MQEYTSGCFDHKKHTELLNVNIDFVIFRPWLSYRSIYFTAFVVFVRKIVMMLNAEQGETIFFYGTAGEIIYWNWPLGVVIINPKLGAHFKFVTLCD